MENNMNVSSFRPRLLGSSVLLAAAIAIGATVPALADNSVVQTLNAGILTASVANGGMSAITVSHANQTSTGTLTLSADDSTGSALGWNVTVQSSAFAYTGDYAATQTAIGAANFSLSAAAEPTLIAGQAVSSVTTATGPQVPPTSPAGTLNSARKVVMASAAYGSGSYTQALDVSLVVPADSRPGTYTGTLTTTIISGSV
jgi:hypothetical protein